jgi:protease I
MSPQVLAAAGTLIGRRTAMLDGQMVSARSWPDHPAWMREFIRILRSKAPA